MDERLGVQASRDGWIRRHTRMRGERDQLAGAVERVRVAWIKARDEDDLPQGFGWPGELYDALEALAEQKP